MKSKLSAVVFFALIFASRAHAHGAMFSVGFAHAGQNLADLTGQQDYEIDAGGGAAFGAALVATLTPTTPHRFELQAGLNYMIKGDHRKGDANTIDWNRYSAEALYFYRNTQEHFRFGYGPTFYFGNEIKARGSLASASASFDNTWGWTFVIEKLIENSDHANVWGLGLKYNLVNFHSSALKADVNANALFLTVSTGFLN